MEVARATALLHPRRAVSDRTATPRSPDDQILPHAVMAALASAIPVPLLDDAVKDRVQRRMVQALAADHGLELSDEQLSTLADDESAFVRGAVKSLVLWPLKKALQKTFIILAARRVVVAASECYQRGLLLDHAFESGFCEPAGPRSATELRAAVDEVIKDVRGGPIESALVAGLGESRLLVTEGLMLLWAKVRAIGGVPAGQADEAAEQMAEAAAPGVAPIVERLKQSVAEVQGEHFDDLRRRLSDRLG